MDAVARMLQNHVDAGTLPGAVAVIDHHGQAETIAVGVQDLQSATPMSPETLFFWDSLGKPMTAALTLVLVADGTVDLDTPIDRLLPELANPRVLADSSGPLAATEAADRPITVEHLLTLRGGLGFTTDFESPFTQALISKLQEGAPACTLDRQAYLDGAGTLPLAHQPGDGWTYNTGSTLLGLFLERAADESLDALIAKRLFEPLGMRDARWWVAQSDLPRFATRYRRSEKPESPLEPVDPPNGLHAAPPTFPNGAGGMIGTANDWLAFGRMLADGGEASGTQVIPRPLVDAMMTDRLTASQRDRAGFFLDDGEGWGYGGSVRSDGSYGWAGGAGTFARVDPRHGRVAILMTQLSLDGPQGSPIIADFETLTSLDAAG